jgi:hypothetical protein
VSEQVRRKLKAAMQENARLKAEVERFKFTLEEERQIAREDWAGLRHENARLRSVAEDNKTECEATRIENARLKEEVERLTKAGDKMAEQLDGLSFDSVWDFWNAAKEGKQP